MDNAITRFRWREFSDAVDKHNKILLDERTDMKRAYILEHTERCNKYDNLPWYQRLFRIDPLFEPSPVFFLRKELIEKTFENFMEWQIGKLEIKA